MAITLKDIKEEEEWILLYYANCDKCGATMDVVVILDPAFDCPKDGKDCTLCLPRLDHKGSLVGREATCRKCGKKHTIKE